MLAIVYSDMIAGLKANKDARSRHLAMSCEAQETAIREGDHDVRRDDRDHGKQGG
jgi:hypothetical protein